MREITNKHAICQEMVTSLQSKLTSLQTETQDLIDALERLMYWHSIIGGDMAELWFMAPESADEEGLEGTNQVWQQARDAIAKAKEVKL